MCPLPEDRATTGSTEVLDADVAIIGVGIAGASLAYFLARHGVADVALIEREKRPAVHASGRSARTLVELDGLELVQRLKIAGARFLREPPEGFTDQPLVTPRGVLHLCDRDRWSEVCARTPEWRSSGLDVWPLAAAEVQEMVEVLDGSQFDGAVWLPSDAVVVSQLAS